MRGRNAFSLIELMVVICLCGVIAGLTIVQLSFLDATIVRSEIEKLAAVCMYAQQLSRATNQEKHLVFDLQKNEYRCDGYREKLSSQVSFGILPGIKGPPGSSVHKIEKAITFSGQRICFYPSGIISSGTVYLVDKQKHCQYALSNAVSQVSYLRIYRYDGVWKLYGNFSRV